MFKIKFTQFLEKRAILIFVFSLLFFIFAFQAHGQSFQVGVSGSGIYQNSITVLRGTPLELKWSFPGFQKCKFPGNFGWPFGINGTTPVTAYDDKTYTITCCKNFNIFGWCDAGADLSLSATINVNPVPPGNEIYWDYAWCDSATNCKGMFVSGSAGYTQVNAQSIYSNLWSGSPLIPNWLPSLNSWVGLYYDNGREVGIVQIVSLDGYWRRGFIFSEKTGKIILTTAYGVWGDNNFLSCNPDPPSGNNQILWSCGSTANSQPVLSCGIVFPFVNNSGTITSPSSLVNRRTTCDLWGGIFGKLYLGITIKNKGLWWNNIAGGIPGWIFTDFDNFYYAIRQDGVWMGPGTLQSGPWSLQSGTHLACTESKTCQIASGPGPDTCSSDSDCGPPLATLNAFCNATPDSGTAPLNGVSVEAWTEGTAQGDITYKFDCTSDGSWEATNTVAQDPSNLGQGTSYTAANICNYSNPGSFNIKVEASQSGLTSNATCLVTVGGGAMPPNTPPNFKALPGADCDKIDLSWTDVSNETRYEIGQSNDNRATWFSLSSNWPADSTSYTVSGLSGSTSYDFRIKACNSAGCSVYVFDSGTTSVCPTGDVRIEIKGPSGVFTPGPITINRNEGIEIQWFGTDVHTCQAFNSSGLPSWTGAKPDSGGPDSINNIVNTTTFSLTCLDDATNLPVTGSAVVNISFKPWWKEIIPW